MDLLQSVRKEGSRGGVNFEWSQVKDSVHRENYLGHSLMAPVGRWQKNKDLSWYAKKDANGKETSEADVRKEELRRIKEAESDAMARALGLEVPPRESGNANMTALGGNKEVQKAVKESIEDVDGGDLDDSKGLGYGVFGGAQSENGDNDEVLAGTTMGPIDPLNSRPVTGRREGREKHHRRADDEDRRRKHRTRSRERERDGRVEHHHRRDKSEEHHHRRDRSEERYHRKDRLENREHYREHRSRTRSRSPRRRRSGSRERRDRERYERSDRHREYEHRRSRHKDQRDSRRSPDPDHQRHRRHNNRTDNY